MGEITSAGQILSLSTGYWQASTLHAGVRLGVFTVLNEGGRSGEEVAAATGAHPRATTVLLNALAAMGLLQKTGDRFTNGPAAARFLVEGTPGYIGYIILHHHHLVDGWAQLDTAVRTGEAVEKRSYGEERERESFQLGMFNLAMAIAPRLAAEIDLAGRRRLLDLGGGPGTYAIHFCLANPGLTAVIFDRPTTEPFARATVERFGLAGRIDFAAGDFNQTPLPAGCDVAWLSQILHSNGPEACQRLIRKTRDALAPGGLVMVHEFLLDDSHAAPLFPALFSLNMLVNNGNGRSYSEGDLRAMLQEAGLKDIRRLAFVGPNDSGIVAGTV
ncbi:MAG: methyltransferase [Thermodesulfobacteriota bacterium]